MTSFMEDPLIKFQFYSNIRSFKQGAKEDCAGVLEVHLQGQRRADPDGRHERVHRLQVQTCH